MTRHHIAVIAGCAATVAAVAAVAASGFAAELVQAWLLVSAPTGCFVWWWDNRHLVDGPQLSPSHVILLALFWPATVVVWFVMQRSSGE